MHVAKWIWCYLNFHKREKLRADESWIASIYIDAIQRIEENKCVGRRLFGQNYSLAKVSSHIPRSIDRGIGSAVGERRSATGRSREVAKRTSGLRKRLGKKLLQADRNLAGVSSPSCRRLTPTQALADKRHHHHGKRESGRNLRPDRRNFFFLVVP